MTWFFAVLIVLAMGAVAVVASGRGASLGTSYDDRADVRLPVDRPVTGTTCVDCASTPPCGATARARWTP